MITQKLDLNLIHGQVRPRVNVSQFDSGTRTLEIAVYNNTARFTLLGTYTVSIEGRKPDNTAFQYDGIIDTVNNVATFDVTEQMTAVYGDVVVEMVINDGDDRIGTGNFILAVEAAPLNDDSVISESVLPLVQRAADIAETIEDTVLPIRVEKDFAPVITTDDAMSKNAIDIKAKIEPVQDLHGYASPWVGGAGDNLLDVGEAISDWFATSNNGTTIVNGDISTKVTATITSSTGSIKVTNYDSTGYWWLSKAVKLKKNTNYKCYYGNSGGSAPILLGFSNLNVGTVGTQITPFYNTQSFNSGNYEYVVISIYPNNVNFSEMQIKEASASATFTPYENICPITGHSELKLTRAGKNILPIDLATLKSGNTAGTWNGKAYTHNNTTFTYNDTNKTISVSTGGGGASATFVFWLVVTPTNDFSKTNYILSGCPAGGGNNKYAIRIYKNGNTYADDTGNGVNVTGTTGLQIGIVIFSGQSLSNHVFKPMLRSADISDNGFEPYNANVYTIDLDGTRYGGTLDVTTGVLTLTNGYKDLGTLSWTYQAEGTRFQTGGIDAKAPASTATKGNIICSQYETVSSNDTWNIKNGVIALGSQSQVQVRDTRYSDAPTFKTAVNGVQLVYELATPQTIALDPQDVLMLWAYNTLFGDTGDISLIYDATGILRIAMEKLDIDTFKAVVAASSDFADFKTRVAAL